MQTLHDIFDMLLSGESVSTMMTKAESESLRIQLWKKYKAHLKYLGEFASTKEKTSTIRCNFVRQDANNPVGRATFTIAVKHMHTRQYEVVKESHGTDVHSNLESNPQSEVRSLDSHTDSQEHGTDADPSSTQGEDSGSSFDEKDWGEFIRSLGAQGSSVPEES